MLAMPQKILLLLLVFLCQSQLSFGQSALFEEMDDFFKEHVKNGLVDYTSIAKDPSEINQLVEQLKSIDLSNREPNYKKAFWINAYNLLTIQKILKDYPTTSPLKINSFFETKNIKVAGEKMSLKYLEKQKLFAQFPDNRLHFVLVCAAIDCPKLKKGAFFPETLDAQIDKRLKVVLNDPQFVKIDRSISCIQLSEIFRWYNADFEKDGIRDFINNYRKVKLPLDYKIKYYDYNWALNDVKNDLITPFRASALLNPGIVEVKVFNSLYTQTTNDGFDRPNSRGSFFSSFSQVLYGWNNSINLGFDLVYKSNVTNAFHDASPFQTLGFKKEWDYPTFDCDTDAHNTNSFSNCNDASMPANRDTLRNAQGQALQRHQSFGLSHFGPKIKFNPIKKWGNLSLQQTLYIPIEKAVDGTTVSFTQLFFDKPIGTKNQLFIEASAWTNISPEFKAYPFVKVFYSYFPTNKWTVYGMTSNLVEYGVGTKLFILPKVEIEFLYTYYVPFEPIMQDRRAMTFNFGIRYQGGLF